MRYLLSIMLCLLASCAWAFPPGFIRAVTHGSTVSGCSTIVDSSTATGSTVSSWDSVGAKGGTFSASAGDSICKFIVLANSIEGPHTLTLRLGTEVNLTTYLAEETTSVTASGTPIEIEFTIDPPISGSTTYYFGINSNATYAQRAELSMGTAIGYSHVYGGGAFSWEMGWPSSDTSLYFKAYK